MDTATVRRRPTSPAPGRQHAAPRLHLPTDTADHVPDAQWPVFQVALRTAKQLGIPFAIGGGLAVAFYTGNWRTSKDLDLYMVRADAQRMIDALGAAGMADYYDEKPYDRSWIYRASSDGVIVDLMWAMANGTGNVDHDWLERGVAVGLRDEKVRLLSPEDLLWTKLHVVQRDRCDWPDLLNLLYANGDALDWQRLLGRCRQPGRTDDHRLLGSLLMLFGWIAPGRAATLPRGLWLDLGLPPPAANGAQRDDERIRLLDSRPWFNGVHGG